MFFFHSFVLISTLDEIETPCLNKELRSFPPSEFWLAPSSQIHPPFVSRLCSTHGHFFARPIFAPRKFLTAMFHCPRFEDESCVVDSPRLLATSISRTSQCDLPSTMDSLASFANSHETTLPDPSFSIGPDGHLRHDFVLTPDVPFSSSNYTDCLYTTRQSTTLPQPIRHHPIWTIHIRARAGPIDVMIHEMLEPALWPCNPHSSSTDAPQQSFEHPRDLLAARAMRFRLMNRVAGEPMAVPFQRFHVVVPRLAAPREWNRIYRVFLYPRASSDEQSGVARALPNLSTAAARHAEALVRRGAVVAPSARLAPSGGDKYNDSDGFADFRGVRLPPSTVAVCRTWARVAAWQGERMRSGDAALDARPLRPLDCNIDKAMTGNWHRSVSARPESAFPLMFEEEDNDSSPFWAAVDAVASSHSLKLLLVLAVAAFLVDIVAYGSFKVVDDVFPALVEGMANLLATVRLIWDLVVEVFAIIVYVLDMSGAIARAVVSHSPSFLAKGLVVFAFGYTVRLLTVSAVPAFLAERLVS
ncbi:uncharacterized protein IWZ02DRAFT_231042 [Phyllosticta citriasiana]|uniref:uncharacterized protein n=1 Tax=Phyllosticta citriasiana TaxID=595635 RepID=UPI0030FD441B